MCFAIEPMFTLGGDDVYVADDGWTVQTVDGSPRGPLREHDRGHRRMAPELLTERAMRRLVPEADL